MERCDAAAGTRPDAQRRRELAEGEKRRVINDEVGVYEVRVVVKWASGDSMGVGDSHHYCSLFRLVLLEQTEESS